MSFLHCCEVPQKFVLAAVGGGVEGNFSVTLWSKLGLLIDPKARTKLNNISYISNIPDKFIISNTSYIQGV